MCSFPQLPLALRLAAEGELPTDENGNYLWPMFPGTPVTELTVFFRRLPAPGLDVTGTLALCGYPAPKPRENGDINKSVALDVVKDVAVVKDDTFVMGIDYPDEARGCYDENYRMLRGRDLIPKFRAGAHKFDQLVGIVSEHMPIQDLFFVNCSAAGKYAFPFVLPKLQQSCLTHSVNFHGPHNAWYATYNCIGQRGSVALQLATSALTVVYYLTAKGYDGDHVRGLADLCGIQNHSVVGQSFDNFLAGTQEKLEAYTSFVSGDVLKERFERKIKVERVIDDVTVITEYPLDDLELWDHLNVASANHMLNRKSTYLDSNAGAAASHLNGLTIVAATGEIRISESYSNHQSAAQQHSIDAQMRDGTHNTSDSAHQSNAADASNTSQMADGTHVFLDPAHQSYVQSCRTTQSLSAGAAQGHATRAARDPVAYSADMSARATKNDNPTEAVRRQRERKKLNTQRSRAKKAAAAAAEQAAKKAKTTGPMPGPLA